MRSSLALLACLAACGGGGAASPETLLGYEPGLVPFPSSVFEIADPSSPTGVRLDLPYDVVPAPEGGERFDPSPLNRRTGWTAAATLLWQAPAGVDGHTLLGPGDLAASVTAASPTVLLDLTTGARVAHFAEVDANETADLAHQAIYLRPAARLAGGHRFAVGIRRSVTAPGGGAIPRPPGFQAVLDDRDTGQGRLDEARPRLRAAVDALEAAGVPRDELIVAWDFTVADDRAAIADAVAARDAALAAIGPDAAGVTYAITSDQGTVNGDPRIARRLDFDFEAPAVTGPRFAGFHRGAENQPVVMGTMTAHAHAFVPPCATATNRAGIVLFGHGFFGDLGELRAAEHLRQVAADGCLVFAGTEWTGMARDDQADALIALGDLNQGYGFGERIFQGVINAITLEQLLRGKLAREVFTDAAGQSIVDPTRVGYLGISNGHILGASLVAYDPFITRGALMVGGANWSLMFERSKNWAAFGLPLKGAYGTIYAQVVMQQILEMQLDLVDGATVAPGQVPRVPAKQYLLQTSVDDCQVPNLASWYHARSLGASVLAPSAATPYGLPPVASPSTTGRTLAIYDEHPTPKPPADNLTFSYDNVAHEHPRRRAAAQAQWVEFWRTGEVRDFCTGTAGCDCAAGACGELRMPAYGGD